VDGLRHPIDYRSLADEFQSQFSLIFVDTPPETRFERSRDRYGTYQQFAAADSHPVESNIDLLRPLAVATISGTMQNEEMISQLGRLVSSFRQRTGL
jgi:hypothetical protein